MAELIFDVQLQERLAVSVMLAAASSPASILFQSNFVHPSQSSPDMSSDMQSIDCMSELTCMKFLHMSSVLQLSDEEIFIHISPKVMIFIWCCLS